MNKIVIIIFVFLIFVSCADPKVTKIVPDIVGTGDQDIFDDETTDLIADDKDEGDMNDDYLSDKDTALPDSEQPDEDTVTEAVCGDSVVEGDEICDGGVKNCVEIDPVYFKSGKAGCKDDCDGWDTITCVEAFVCGDSIIENPEVCEKGDTKLCVDIDPSKWEGGKALCSDDCLSWDTVTCEQLDVTCGDGVQEYGELCEDGDAKMCKDIDSSQYYSGSAPCNSSCDGWDTSLCVPIPVCGNSVVEVTETCEKDETIACSDLNVIYVSGTAECESDCKSWDISDCKEPVCGDGSVNGGEVCELGEIFSCKTLDNSVYSGGNATCRANCNGWDPSACETDADGDGYSNVTEEMGISKDTDNDGTPDYLDKDSDDDWLPDAREKIHGTNRTDKDSDSDGVDDVIEIALGTNPLNSGSVPDSDILYSFLPCGESSEQKNISVEYSEGVSRADIVFMLDLSGSMGEEHANIKSNISSVIDDIRSVIPDSAFAVAPFGTLEDQVYNMTLPVTTDYSAVSDTVNNLAACGGSNEYHAEVLYQAVTGEGTYQVICTEKLIFGGEEIETINISASTCSGTTTGGACFREDTTKLIIMASDEQFDTEWERWDAGQKRLLSEAIEVMNDVDAKFIGLDSGDAMTDFDLIADGTGTVDESGDNFNRAVLPDGSDFSSQLADAVTAFLEAFGGETDPVDISASASHVSNSFGVSNTADFVQAITPSVYVDTQPGETVDFTVTLENESFGSCIYDHTDGDPHTLSVEIDILFDTSVKHSKKIYIIVPSQ